MPVGISEHFKEKMIAAIEKDGLIERVNGESYIRADEVRLDTKTGKMSLYKDGVEVFVFENKGYTLSSTISFKVDLGYIMFPVQIRW